MTDNQDPIIPLLVTFLTTPESDFYLVKLIQQSQSPTLEPFQQGQIDLGTQQVAGMSMEIALSNVLMHGISNIQINKVDGQPQIEVVGNQVTFHAIRPNTEAPPPAVPAALTATANFTATPPNYPPLPGTVDIAVQQAEFVGVFNATLQQADQWDTAQIDFTSLQLNAAATPANIAIALNINSAFKSLIQQVLNQPAVLSSLLSAINTQLTTPQVLQAVSQPGTQAARSALGKLTGDGA